MTLAFTTPAILSELRTALRIRCQLDPNDPRAADALLNSDINYAIDRFTVANPQGWPWDIIEDSTVTLVAGATSQILNAKWRKVRYIILEDVAGGWQYPLERVQRLEQIERYPDVTRTGSPRCYSLLGNPGNADQIIVRYGPIPDLAYPITIGGWVPSLVITSDAQLQNPNSDYMIQEYADIILEYAAFLQYRKNNALSEAIAAKAMFDTEVLRLRRTVRRTAGLSVGQNPVADDIELG